MRERGTQTQSPTCTQTGRCVSAIQRESRDNIRFKKMGKSGGGMWLFMLNATKKMV